MRYKHPDSEKPRIDFSAIPTPTYDAFETVTLSVQIYGTGTAISVDMPPENARQWAAEIIRACDMVEKEQAHEILRPMAPEEPDQKGGRT